MTIINLIKLMSKKIDKVFQYEYRIDYEALIQERARVKQLKLSLFIARQIKRLKKKKAFYTRQISQGLDARTRRSAKKAVKKIDIEMSILSEHVQNYVNFASRYFRTKKERDVQKRRRKVLRQTRRLQDEWAKVI